MRILLQLGQTFALTALLAMLSAPAQAAVSPECLAATPASNTVTGSATAGSVWGSPSTGYTVDSSLATVAVHAGLLAPGATGSIKVTALGQVASFAGTTANGVTTTSFGSYCGMSVARGTAQSTGGLPTIAVQYSPSLPLIAGADFTLSWQTTNTTSLTRVCTAQGTGFTSTSLPSNDLNGSLQNVAWAAWVGYPSTCTWTAIGPNGTTNYTETRTTITPPPIGNDPPTISILRTPTPMLAGQNFSIVRTTTNATKVSLKCTASGTGFVSTYDNLAANGSDTATANVEWVGYPSECTWTAIGPGGTKSYTETWTTITPNVPPPTIAVSYSSAPLVAGKPFTLRWQTTNATAVTRVCTAQGTGFTSSALPSNLVNGSLDNTAESGWINYPSTCVWTAIGQGGTKTITETRTTVAPPPVTGPPTINVVHTPTPMVAGQNFTVAWSTTNATSVGLTCTASGTGFVYANQNMGSTTDSTTTQALAAWVGYPSSCTWTASGPQGTKTFTETWQTVAADDASTPTLEVSYSSMPLVKGKDFTLTWKSTNATSVTRECSASGTGFTSPLQSMASTSGSITSNASADWVGYPSTCKWTAIGAKNSKIVTEVRTTLDTPSPVPTITVQYAPATLLAGQPFTVTWNSTNADKVSYDCKSNGQGFALTAGPSGTFSKTAELAWVTTPLVCNWTAIGGGGSTTKRDTLTTQGQANTETITFFHNDVAGTPLMATDSAGSVLWKENYLPYGAKLANPAAAKDNSVGYAGSPFDASTGLSYMGARYYDPAIGRFMGMDPVGVDLANVHSVNRYTYANNNPYRFNDPKGRSAEDIYGDTGSFSSANSGFSTATKAGFVLGGIAGVALAGGCDAVSAGACVFANGPMIASSAALGAGIGAGIDRAWKQLDKMIAQSAVSTGPTEYQYALIAERNGLYPDVRNGLVQLKEGEVWKYGVSFDPDGRYPASALATFGLQMKIQRTGTRIEVLTQEKIKLIEYAIMNGTLPPGNKIFR